MSEGSLIGELHFLSTCWSPPLSPSVRSCPPESPLGPPLPSPCQSLPMLGTKSSDNKKDQARGLASWLPAVCVESWRLRLLGGQCPWPPYPHGLWMLRLLGT